MQQTDELLEAIERYLAGNATAAQRQLVNDWYHSFDDELVTVETVDVAYEELLEARLRLRLAESTGIGAAGKTEVKRVRLWPRIAVAAAAVAAITLGTWIYMNVSPDVKSGDEVAKVNDIAPGKNGATITLGNGRVIQLSDAKSGVVVGGEKGLVYDDNTSVISSDNTVISNEVRDLLNSTDKGSLLRRDDGQGVDRRGVDGKGANRKGGEAGAAAQMLTASTAKGQTYQFTLPDGTKVWLNADSKISFPSQFNGRERKILLEGEGYFEVVKNKTKPFIVESAGQKVTVLGTHFNVNAYAGESTKKTTLLEGSVNVNGTMLHPNQQSITTGSNRITVANVDVNEAIAWKNGLFVFDNETLESIMQRVARWYDVEVNYEADASLKESTFSGTISRFSNISKVLERLERTGIVKFELKGKQLKVKK